MTKILYGSLLGLITAFAVTTNANAANTLQIGATGKTFASSSVKCSVNPATGLQAAMVQVGLFNPKSRDTAAITLNGELVAKVSAAQPSADVWLNDGNNTVVVALSRRSADTFTFVVQQGFCDLPDTSGNTFSADGVLEYAASGKSYATVSPGCAFNPSTGNAQPFVNLFDNGAFLLNVSNNGTPITQLNGSTRRSTPIFLSAGINVISAANGTASTDYYVRDGGSGVCALP